MYRLITRRLHSFFLRSRQQTLAPIERTSQSLSELNKSLSLLINSYKNKFTHFLSSTQSIFHFFPLVPLTILEGSMVVPASMLPQKEGPSYSDFHLLLFRGESGILLAGHSHWHNIQYRKARQDAIKNMRNSKLSLEISAAVKAGGADPKTNPRLSLLLQRAKSLNFPKEKIEIAIQSGLGKSSEGAERVMYEGYGPGGTAIVIETMTNNRNRTAQRLRIAFNKYGGNLASSGCVSWMFKKKGLLVFKYEPSIEEKILEMAMELGAEDFKKEDNTHQIKVYCEVEDLIRIRDELSAKGFTAKRVMIVNIPTQINELPDEETAESLRKLIDAFEEVDEVVTVIHNAGSEEDDYLDED